MLPMMPFNNETSTILRNSKSTVNVDFEYKVSFYMTINRDVAKQFLEEFLKRHNLSHGSSVITIKDYHINYIEDEHTNKFIVNNKCVYINYDKLAHTLFLDRNYLYVYCNRNLDGILELHDFPTENMDIIICDYIKEELGITHKFNNS